MNHDKYMFKKVSLRNTTNISTTHIINVSKSYKEQLIAYVTLKILRIGKIVRFPVSQCDRRVQKPHHGFLTPQFLNRVQGKFAYPTSRKLLQQARNHSKLNIIRACLYLTTYAHLEILLFSIYDTQTLGTKYRTKVQINISYSSKSESKIQDISKIWTLKTHQFIF